MDNLEDITLNLGTIYEPKSALVIYKSNQRNSNDIYVEHFDLDNNGNLLNAHPLTIREAQSLAKALSTRATENGVWNDNTLLPENVLYISSKNKDNIIWYTKRMQRELFFIKNLEMPSGKADIPPLLWCADNQRLQLFALMESKRPTRNTPLYNAPFLNIGANGKVCMGTVIRDKKCTSIADFIKTWESYFFNSYFSHLLGQNPIRGNCINLWKKLIKKGGEFPLDVLKENDKTLKDLLR